eukprot:COSAG01_NODE_60014_length_297_cov_0.005051_1_plen_53_part_10
MSWSPFLHPLGTPLPPEPVRPNPFGPAPAPDPNLSAVVAPHVALLTPDTHDPE